MSERVKVNAGIAKLAHMLKFPVWAKPLGAGESTEFRRVVPNGRYEAEIQVPGSGLVRYECRYFVQEDALTAIEVAQGLGAAANPDVVLHFSSPAGPDIEVSCCRSQWEDIMAKRLKQGFSFLGSRKV